jgi:membrane protease YdiL (CAAX protease family)
MKVLERIIETAKRHYIATLIILLLGIFISLYMVSLTYWGSVFSGLIISIPILIIVKFIGCINVFGFKKKNILRGLGASYPVICIGICAFIVSLLYINHIGFMKPDTDLRFLFLGYNLPYFPILVGTNIIFLFGMALFEELVHRGIILNILIKNCKKDKLFSIMVASCIFGVSHLIKLVDGIEDLAWTIPQVLYTTVLGIFWSVIYLKYNNIWSVVIIHFLFNCLSFFPFILFSTLDNFFKFHSVKTVGVIDVLVFIPILIYSLHLYRNMDNKRDGI